MLSNKDIKRREIFKAKQDLIKVNGEMKKAQQDYLYATNEVALAEYRGDNKLKQGVIAIRFKQAVKTYMRVYGRKVALEEHIRELENWEARDLYESTFVRKT